MFPRAKVIVSLRDPLSRAVSQHNHYSQIVETSADWDWRKPGSSFDENVQAELDSQLPSWRGLLGRGLYADQLVHLTEFIPRHRVHILIMEEWIQNPQAALNDVIRFLELEPCELTITVDHQREHHVSPPSEAVSEQFVEFFRPHNEKLFNWLGREIVSWH